MVRVLRHKTRQGSAFTRKYRVHRLVYTQAFQNIGDAIAGETQIKGWARDKKLTLIRLHNPTWEDIAAGWGEPAAMQLKGKQVPPLVGMTRLFSLSRVGLWGEGLKLQGQHVKTNGRGRGACST